MLCDYDYAAADAPEGAVCTATASEAPHSLSPVMLPQRAPRAPPSSGRFTVHPECKTLMLSVRHRCRYRCRCYMTRGTLGTHCGVGWWGPCRCPTDRKRRRTSPFYEFVESHKDQQVPSSCPSSLHGSSTALHISTAHTIITSSQPEPFDDAITLQDLQVRTDLAIATHRIAKQLKMRDELYAEHVRLIDVMKERKLAVPEGGPIFT
ncbi:hypothetical protein DFH09DRAFT_1313053 [Mycena vulgaris]|nr:hypothetical protein DFH09DRAFT_1313053 [Mycena vulgaris]